MTLPDHQYGMDHWTQEELESVVDKPKSMTLEELARNIAAELCPPVVFVKRVPTIAESEAARELLEDNVAETAKLILKHLATCDPVTSIMQSDAWRHGGRNHWSLFVSKDGTEFVVFDDEAEEVVATGETAPEACQRAVETH